ncbi:15289_t:CDS:2, partial [Cetraspora pellucida]
MSKEKSAHNKNLRNKRRNKQNVPDDAKDFKSNIFDLSLRNRVKEEKDRKKALKWYRNVDENNKLNNDNKNVEEVEKAKHKPKPSEQVKGKDGLEDKLKDLINCYLETLTAWMPKSDIFEEPKPTEMEESKASNYHQKSVK